MTGYSTGNDEISEAPRPRSAYAGSPSGDDRARRALARRPKLFFGRPRFVVVLACAAAGWVLYEAVRATGLDGGYEHTWFGLTATGGLAYTTAALRVVLYLVGAYGLWMLKPWARIGGMIYLGSMLAGSMLWWQPDGYGAHNAGLAVVRQVSVIPLVTFCMMYLYREDRWFRGRTPSSSAKKS